MLRLNVFFLGGGPEECLSGKGWDRLVHKV